MILKSGFFHADPHPGNILICKGSEASGQYKTCFVFTFLLPVCTLIYPPVISPCNRFRKMSQIIDEILVLLFFFVKICQPF